MRKITLITLMLFTALSYTQVGINTNTPDASSALEIESTTGGILIPRMTENQRNAIVSPAAGLMVYQTDETLGFYFFNGSVWEKIDGVAGPQGDPGPQGIQGIAGNNGADGEDGAQGPIGNTGPQGETGAVGPAGAQGVQGLPGNNGVNGLNGTDGANGVSAYEVWLSLGNTGTEQDFIDSLTGPSGNGIESTTNNGDGSFTFNYTDGTSFTTSDLTGPQGDNGISSGSVNVFFGTPEELNITNNPENSILYNTRDNKFYLITYRGSSGGGYIFMDQSSVQQSSTIQGQQDYILSFKVTQSVKVTGIRFYETSGYELFQDKTNDINNGLGFEVDFYENGFILNPQFTYYVVIHGGVNDENPYGNRSEFTINNLFSEVKYYSVNFGSGYGSSNNNFSAPDSFRENSSDISGFLTERNDFLPMYYDNSSYTGVRNIEYEVLDNSLVLLPITGQ